MYRITMLATIFVLALVVSAMAQDPGGRAPAPPTQNSLNSGKEPVDPTKNVLDLVEQMARRQDDLRAAGKELFDAKLAGLDATNAIRSKYDRELLKAATDRLDAEAKLRAEFQSIIAATEKARVDAIRLVDTGAVAIANERATATANTLAKTVTDTAQALSAQVTRNAEDFRLLVKTTADEQTRSLQQQFSAVQNQFSGMSTRITALEQTGAEGLGKQRVQDPALIRALEQIENLTRARVGGQGVNEGRSDVIGWIAGGLGLVIALVGLFFASQRSRGNGSHTQRRNGAVA